ncbi:D-alanyl-D-alanine carboxypeptidase (penicillin-binding protein 5/6) [Clostridium pascui]|uniref:D-alanyl-D-alanine carboxypeptidase family protein n=1 Tax=Clostridium pascui TaxID=46609 RepID=UPI001958CA43|nr:D-alanyl-D-alanine carboxypeptidase family protein [Clostridium pascui]MBM7869187.1 D-alanyl-D-alanine carboxypeptidase (penicillin-binding protein 5/6) [Clostridium pascui]
MKKINKKIISKILIGALIFSGVSFSPVKAKAQEEGGIQVEAKSALLMEPNSGKILYEKNSHEKLAPASVTKIMTMLLAMEAVDSGKIKLTDKMTVSENAKMKGKNGNSSMLLDTGEVRTVEEILKGIAIASGNDAATAMAEYLSGSEEAFVKLMNDRAQELGMKDTTFKNCSGLSAPGHITTAYDISLMSRELLKHSKVLKYTGTYMETISEGRKSPIGLVNHNKLVRFFKGCDGLKTGFTNEAKYCISTTAVRDGVRVLAVIMGAPTFKVRNRDASMLMNYGFSKFESKKVVEKDKDIEKIKIGKSEDKFFMARALEDLNITLERGANSKVEKKCIVNMEKKRYNKGEVIGYCEVYVDGKLSGKVKIYCDRDIQRSNFLDNLKFNFKNLFDKSV